VVTVSSDRSAATSTDKPANGSADNSSHKQAGTPRAEATDQGRSSETSGGRRSNGHAGTWTLATPGTRYSVALARDPADVRAAQRLRHEVFAGELGATLRTPVPGLDIEALDAYCDHLIVRDERTGAVVGTYRLLPPAGAAAAGALYAQTEFDLTALDPIRVDLVETGRTCVHRDHRGGAVVGLLWAGIARYMIDSGHGYLAGCCSVPLDYGGLRAARAWDRIEARHLSPEEYRVVPYRPWEPPDGRGDGRVPPPALLRGYLRLGSWVCGPPAYDPEFDVADFFVLLPLERVDSRFLRALMATTSRGVVQD